MESSLPKIAVSSVPDPMNPKSWSRTPLNVAEALARRGRLGPAIQGIPHGGWRARAAAAASALYYRLPPRFVTPARASRKLHARHMGKMIRESGTTHVLHFSGIRYLPLPPLPGVRQYLFIDAAWRDYWDDIRDRSPREGRFRLDLDRQFADAYRQMDHVFPVAQYVRDTLVNHYRLDPARITVVGTGPGIIRPYEGPKDYANGTLLFAVKGGFEPKGGRLLLEAFQIARRARPELKLWMVGAERLTEADRQAPGVTFFPFMPLDELQRLFNEAALFAMPAPFEHWGLVYVEALGCGLPLLGLNRKAFPELCGHGRHGFIVPDPYTPAAVADTILRAVADPAALRRKGEEGRRFALERFTWDAVVDRILTTIDSHHAQAPSANKVG